MAVNCKVTLNSQILYPLLPIDISDEAIGTAITLANGNERFYHRKTLKRWTLRDVAASEATATTWRTASPLNAALTFVDETGTSYTVRVESRTIPLVLTTPVVNEALNTTGPGFYDLEISLRQIQ